MATPLLNQEIVPPVYDPYDLWSTQLGVDVRRRYYAGKLGGKLGAIGLGVLDWLIPNIIRKVTRARPRIYPIVVAHEILRLKYARALAGQEAVQFLELLKSVAVDPVGASGWAWGLGFPWMSKNGLYGADIPFVTHTPYVMEALLALADFREVQSEAYAVFRNTLDFLDALKVMHQGDDDLAVSYAPVDEPRIVVNANAYASLSYVLHAIHGVPEVRPTSRDKAIRTARWVIRQQQPDGSWFYYADSDTGNFIDCFHSCFVIKNLLKVRNAIPDISAEIDVALEQGWRFVKSEIFDHDHGLCKRFIHRDIRDPFRWDLYDQAEYLGLLLDFGQLMEATQFDEQVTSCFRQGGDWFSRLDITGRRWGKNYLRWGIAPYLYHQARLHSNLTDGKGE